MAAEAPSRAERLAWREAARFLELSNEQLVQVQAARVERDQALRELTARAATAAGGGVGADALAHICREAQQREAAYQGKVSALLQPQQLQRLDQLRSAFRMMPLVESAQSAGLLPEALQVVPIGLPEGSAEVAVRWQRVPAAPLPGCTGTTVHREVAGEEPPARKLPR